MNAGAERRREDLAKVEALAAASGGRLVLVSREGNPPTDITIDLACRTAGSSAYPARAVDRTRARISLPARYPFQPPAVYLTPVTFHPNVYSSGLVCLGRRCKSSISRWRYFIVVLISEWPRMIESRTTSPPWRRY